jgi:hypothetical protein
MPTTGVSGGSVARAASVGLGTLVAAGLTNLSTGLQAEASVTESKNIKNLLLFITLLPYIIQW